MTVLWLGAGLSCRPGIRRLANLKIPLVVVDSVPGAALRCITGTIGRNVRLARASEEPWQTITSNLKQGDVVVSMLQTDSHLEVAVFANPTKSGFLRDRFF